MKILFVCHGNICRSPLAEFLMKYKLDLLGLDAEVSSKATSCEEIGNPVYYAIEPYLKKLNADYKNKKAERMTKQDGDYYDYIIVMDENNLRNAKKILDGKNYEKLFKLCDFTSCPRDVSDPWYTRDFDSCYADVDEGLDCFIEFLRNKKLLIKNKPDYDKNNLTKDSSPKLELSAMAIVIYNDKVLTTTELIYGKPTLSLPKGHKEENETLLETAKRECYEETNITLSDEDFITKLPSWSYDFATPDGKAIRKTIEPFLFKVVNAGNPLPKEERMISVDWMPFSEFIEKCHYDNVVSAVKKAINVDL